jgi:hypothetical protein
MFSISLCAHAFSSLAQAVEVVMIYVYEAVSLVLASVLLGTGIGTPRNAGTHTRARNLRGACIQRYTRS